MRQRVQVFAGIILTLVVGNLALAWCLMHLLTQDGADRLTRLRQQQEDEMVAEMRGRVDVACNLIRYIMKSSGSIEAAQAAAIDACSEIRFGDGNYLWVHQMNPDDPESALMLVHPAEKYRGQDVTGHIDLERVSALYHEGEIVPKTEPRVKSLEPVDVFGEFNRVCLRYGEGTVGYYWPKVKDGVASEAGYRKISFVKYLPEWNWIVGAGAYADAIDLATQERAVELANEHTKLVRLAQAAVFLVSVATVIVVSLLVWRSTKRQIGELRAEVEERKRAEERIALDVQRSATLLALNRMDDAPLQEITDFALEESVRLTGSTIGYLAFVNEDMTVMTMHSWSKTAMRECSIVDKPFVYSVDLTGLWGEAIRQQRPIITNDYAADNPWKKGTPVGHVKLVRHMNVPVFAGGRIVIVAGVGNKTEDYDETDVTQLTLIMEGMWGLIERVRAEEKVRQLNVELERRVQHRTIQLETANKELESFAHTVSHDLRAPLRAVDGFSQALSEEYEGKLDETACDYLRRIRGGAKRMGLLIDDLLRLSRLTRTEMHFGRVNLSDLTKSVVAELREAYPDRSVEFQSAEDALVHADSALMRIALENLLGNAWKFTGNRETARIEFGVLRENGSTTYFIKDNGAGFDMAHKAKLFGVFQRLHDACDFPGTGIGLATVQRIIHRHGGRIWAESSLNG
ncbi:MAG: GAF domain-containing protein, partial [Candidatus Hydrogenedentales bacterium]